MRLSLAEYTGSGFITVDVSKSNQALRLVFDASELDSILWPGFRRVARAEELWRTTCLELFLGHPDRDDYLELNFSPSGHWNAYRFTGYRAGMSRARDVNLLKLESIDDKVLVVTVRIDKLRMPLLLGPAAVIESLSGRPGYFALSYFALKHGEQPDFHDASLHCRVDHL